MKMHNYCGSIYRKMFRIERLRKTKNRLKGIRETWGKQKVQVTDYWRKGFWS